ncbi:MAG: DUF4397 domain-containing protein [Fimbriimonadaceae bacterium]|nr:DUF4397 domain-containing protein [Fimbriimonadaceae bacterium]
MTRAIGVMVCFVIGLLAVGCGGSGGNGSLPNPLVRVINVSPDSVALDLLIDDTTIASAIAYLGSTPDFVSVDPGDRDVVTLEHGTTLELTAEVQTFAKNKSYLAIALGLENFGTENLKRLRTLIFELDRTVPNGNKARLFVVHAYSRAVGLDTPNIDFQTPGDNPLFKVPNLAFGTNSAITVDSGLQTFEARRNGTTAVLASGTFTLEAGKLYAAIVTGVEGEAAPKDPKIVLIEIQPKL